MRKFLPLLLVIAGLYGYQYLGGSELSGGYSEPTSTPAAAPQATSSWRAGQQVQGSGEVIRILSDDNDGSRHQRFILELSSGRTLLIAHNIDLAPRISGLRVGDTVSFYGEYEPNPQGGVIHWTHHDPQGRHADGWLEHEGRRYR
jgi:hypothetical protein